MAPLLAQRPRTDRAFERMYQRHVGDVYRYSLAVLRNPSDAEDVTQTTFLNAYRAFQRGERPDAAQNWLIKIAHNVCRQRFRTSSRRPQEVEFDEGTAAALVEDGDGPSAEDIRRGLGQLAFNQRAALVARELEGRSYAEIGEILGLSVSAVETLIFRARRALREQLEGSLTCHEAELATSRQLDGRLPRAEKGALRAHLRQCAECATFARRLRAQRTALKALAAVPLPGSLATFFGGTSVGSGLVALKLGAVASTLLAAGAVTTVGTKHAPWQERDKPAIAASASAAATPALLRPALRVFAPAAAPAKKPRSSAKTRPPKRRAAKGGAAGVPKTKPDRGRSAAQNRGKPDPSARSAGGQGRTKARPVRKSKPSSKASTTRKPGKAESRQRAGDSGGGRDEQPKEKAKEQSRPVGDLPDLPLPQPPVELPKIGKG